MSEIVSGVEELPTGAVNVFAESGSEGAELLVSSPDVPAISFTGSTHTGRLIARAAAEHLKRVGLELGGKTPHLVLDDADLEAALPVLEKSATVFAGQFCMTGSRVLAHRSIADELRAALAQRLEHVRVGPASDPDNELAGGAFYRTTLLEITDPRRLRPAGGGVRAGADLPGLRHRGGGDSPSPAATPTRC